MGMHKSGLREKVKLLKLFQRRLSTAVVGWGANDGGELGPNISLEDQLVPNTLKTCENVHAVNCGYGTTHFHSDSLHNIFSFGLNSAGQLGNKNDCPVEFNSTVLGVAAGRAHALILTSEAVYAAGANIQGQCGLRQGVKFTEGYERIELPFYASDVKQICCGLDNSIILTKDGKIFSSGLGADGQTGVGSLGCQYGFVQVNGAVNSYHVVQVSSTTDTCLALSEDGAVFGWGNNEQAQLSKELQEKQIAIPTQVFCSKSFPNISQVLAGGSFSSILADGDVYVQGYGALGVGPKHLEVHEFTKVHLDHSFGKVTMISGSADYLAALTDTGILLTWGRGNHGRLGQGNSEDTYYPKEVQLPGKVLKFACGNDHMVAVVLLEDNEPL